MDNYTITLNSNYPDKSSSSPTPDVTESITITSPYKLTEAQLSKPNDWSNNWHFVGFFDESVGGNQITKDTEFSSDTTIYAQWKCVVNFYNNDELYYSINVAYNSEIEDPYPSEGVIDNFNGWLYELDDEEQVRFPFTVTKNIDFNSIISKYEIPSNLIIGSHSFEFNANYLSSKSNRPTSDFIVTEVTLPRNYGQSGFNTDIESNLTYILNGVEKSIKITQKFPKFARFETFDSKKYIAVAEGWGNSSNNGSSWNSATTLSHAVEILNERSSRDTILIFDGNYNDLPDLTGVNVKLVNGTDSIANNNLKLKDQYNGSYRVRLNGGKIENNIIYDKLFDNNSIILDDGKTYVRCTFTFKPNLVNSIFKSCIFISQNTNAYSGEDGYCIHGISSELGLDSSYKPIYGSIICGNAEDSDFTILDYVGQPRNRSGVDLGCYEYQYNFIPNSVGVIKTIPDDPEHPGQKLLVKSDPSINEFDWFDNSISGYSFSVEVDENYIGEFYYTIYSGRVENTHLFNHNSPTSVYLTVYQIESSNIYVDNFNYSIDESTKTRYPYYSLINPGRYGVTPVTTGIVVTNLRTAVNLFSGNNNQKIILCRGIYPQSLNSVSIDKEVTIESNTGADETILLGDGNDSTDRFITVNNTNLSLTGVTIVNSKSKKPTTSSDNNRYGGAIARIGNSGNVNVVACRFENCEANYGGSVYNSNLYNCIINNSTSETRNISKYYPPKNPYIETGTNPVSGDVILIDNDIYNLNNIQLTITVDVHSGAYMYEGEHHWSSFTIEFFNNNNGKISFKAYNDVYINKLNIYYGDNDRSGTHWFENDTVYFDQRGSWPPDWSFVWQSVSLSLDTVPYKCSYTINPEHNTAARLRINIPAINYNYSISGDYSISNGELYNCTILGNISNSTNISGNCCNCINLSNKSILGDTNVNGSLSEDIKKFYRIPYNITNVSAEISSKPLVNNGGSDVDNYLDFNLSPRGYQK